MPAALCVCLLAVLPLAAAACSGSSSPTTTTKPVDSAAAPALIAQSFGTLFDFSNKSVNNKVAVIQGGAQVKASLEQALASPLSSASVGAKIDSSTVESGSACTSQHISSPCAKVSYEIEEANGSSITESGYAVYDNGSWLVAKATICSLLDLFYQASGKSGSPAGC